MTVVWLCGQYRSGDWPNSVWDVQGVFADEQAAIQACRNENYFVMPLNLNEILPDEPVMPPGFFYPLDNRSRP
jgi:hypothetical protein